ncbi:MAG: Serine/threonine-protein kinase PknD [Mycoplasmataceae bacterium]|nr:Serine/threonine-protein kinase PknD [Mycoplasmataceae bacterium]WNE41260.1 MAG: Serine/threonine-protein kinase PknD [Mycoplasmataceae bacterium]
MEFLKNFSKLRLLNISNTNINQGLEYLPESLETFYYYSLKGSNFQVREIAKIINAHGGDWKNYQKKLFEEWKNQGFSSQEIKKWINSGLISDDYIFAYYLKKDNYQPQQITKDNLEELRKKCAWQDLHPEFNYSLRKIWENQNLDRQETQEWLEHGWKNNEIKYVQEWRNNNFAAQASREWIEAGFESQESELAKKWFGHGFNSQESQSLISAGFDKNLSKNDYRVIEKWKSNKIHAQEIKKWINSGLTKNEQKFANYLKNERSLTPQLTRDHLEELRNEYIWWQEGFDHKQRKEWIEAGFQAEKYKQAKLWKERKFTTEQVKTWIKAGAGADDYNLINQWETKNFTFQKANQWIVAGARANDYEFISWLRNIKQETPAWVTNYQVDYQILSERFKKYGLCPECQQPSTGEKWCKNCNIKNSEIRFSQLNQSGKPQIDQFIQKYQLKATEVNKFIEWIPYEQFTDTNYLAQGGFSKVYQAQWKKGNIQYWDQKKNQWQRDPDQGVVLKILNHSKSNIYFLAEAEKHKIIDDWFNNLIPCYGLSQDPETGNYLMVMQYLPERDLRNYLRKNNQELKEKTIDKKKIKQEVKNLESEIKGLKIQLRSIEQKRGKNVIFKWLINSVRSNLKNKNYEGKVEVLFKNLPIDKEEFLTELESIEFGLSKKISTDELNKIYQPRLELTESEKKNENLFQKKKQKLNNLRSELTDLQDKLSIKNKLNQLINITQGLKDIHQKNLVHRDFHPGNILKGLEQTSCLITDLGLCKQADQISQEEKIFGVLPYVAPEVLTGQSYSLASDIYSFGMVAYELLTGLPPYYDRAHDFRLGIEIFQGLRPSFQIKIPILLEKLINQCWNSNPIQRPTAHELEKNLRSWQSDGEFTKQIQETEKYNQTLPLEIRFPDFKFIMEQFIIVNCYQQKRLLSYFKILKN